MDRSAVQAIVEREAPPLCERLGIDGWNLRFQYEPNGVDSEGYLQHGECTRMVDYHSAHIRLNPESFDDEAALMRTLRHELFHVVLAPFDLYSSAVEQVVGEDHLSHAVLDRVWTHACEGAVIALERMFGGLTDQS
jgi:hypothetical protein